MSSLATFPLPTSVVPRTNPPIVVDPFEHTVVTGDTGNDHSSLHDSHEGNIPTALDTNGSVAKARVAEPNLSSALPTTNTYIGDSGISFTLIKHLGSGAMGTVYLASYADSEGNQKEAAIKVIKAELLTNPKQGPVVKKRLKREISAMNGIDNSIAGSEYVAKILDSKIDEVNPDRSFIAMEYYPGGDYANKLKEDPELTLDRVMDITIQILKGLGAVHELDIVHRDLKPANVFFDNDGTPKVADFGLAKEAYDPSATYDLGATQTGGIVGTPRFMSPEQARGDKTSLGPMADIYTTISMLYYTMTGKYAFSSDDNVKLIQSIQQCNEAGNRPKSMRFWNSSIPVELDNLVIGILTEPDPNKRRIKMGLQIHNPEPPATFLVKTIEGILNRHRNTLNQDYCPLYQDPDALPRTLTRT